MEDPVIKFKLIKKLVKGKIVWYLIIGVFIFAIAILMPHISHTVETMLTTGNVLVK